MESYKQNRNAINLLHCRPPRKEAQLQ